MDDTGPPASQPANSYPIIFKYPTENPIPLFVEASKIPERPKLIRSLTRHGASICTSPADADIILVDSSTDPGLQFIRDWSGDADKVILEYSWAFKCITAGRPLLRDDNFADCIAVDDGRAYEMNDDDDGPENPLPTPRPTPSDAGQPTTQSHALASTQPKVDPGSRLASTEIPVEKDPSPPLNTHMSPTTQTFQQSQHQNQIPASQASSQFQQSHPWAQFNSTQQFTPSQTLPIEFNNPFTQPGSSTQIPQPSTIDPKALYAGFMDYMRLHAGFQESPMPMNMHPAQMQQTFMAQQTNSSYFVPQFDADQPVSMILSPAVNGQPPNVTSLSTPVGLHSSSPQICEPSISRRSPLPETPPSPTPPGTSKGKERAVYGSTKRKRTPPKYAYIPSEDEGIGISTPPVTKIPEDRRRKAGEIFRSPSGEQLLFFVQVDLPGRAGTVQPIRKHGGKMVGSISDADFVVLGYPQSSTYKDLVAQAQACNKVPLKSTFVADCVKHLALLDQESYALHGVSSTKRQRTSSATKVQRSKKSTRTTKTSTVGRSLSPGPTPPPLNTRVEAVPGKFKYPPEEINWFKKFARFHFERDPKTSNTMLFKLAHEKMSHHSAKAWQYHISRELPNELDTIRKRVGIAHRKAADTNNGLHSNSSTNAEAGPSKPGLGHVTVEPMAVDKPSLIDNAWKLDFQDICAFFANGGAHEESDDATVWASLEAETQCRTAPSWPEFYTAHEKEIVDEIDRLVES